MTTTTKTCPKCNEAKSTLEFYKNKAAKDGLAYRCKVCHKASNKTWYEANPDYVKASGKAWRESNLDKKKAYLKAWNEANPDYDKAWYEANKDHLRGYRKDRWDALTQVEQAAMGSVNQARTRSELSSADLYGGLSFTDACTMTVPFAEERLRLEQETGVAHHIDHIIPIAAGGTHTKDNLQVLTAADNGAKIASDKLLVAEATKGALSNG